MYGDYLENDLHIVIRKLGVNKSINSVEVLQILWNIYIYNIINFLYFCTIWFFSSLGNGPESLEHSHNSKTSEKYVTKFPKFNLVLESIVNVQYISMYFCKNIAVILVKLALKMFQVTSIAETSSKLSFLLMLKKKKNCDDNLRNSNELRDCNVKMAWGLHLSDAGKTTDA